MRIKRGHGGVTLVLQGIEAQVLGHVLDELDTTLAGGAQDAPGDPVWRRLHPDAFGDDEQSAEFHRLTDEDLDADRIARIGACRQELAGGGSKLRLDGEALERWLTVTNDVRLSLGVRLGITAEDDGRIDPDAPEAEARSVYYWLTALQSNLVDAAMRV